MTSLGVGLADIVGYIIGALLVSCIGIKKTLGYSFALASIGGLVTLTYGLSHQDKWIFPVLFFLIRLGCTSSFTACYVGNREVFPALVATGAMGICQVPARLASAIVSFCSQMEQPKPMIIFMVLSIVAMLSTLTIRRTEGIKISLHKPASNS